MARKKLILFQSDRVELIVLKEFLNSTSAQIQNNVDDLSQKFDIWYMKDC